MKPVHLALSLVVAVVVVVVPACSLAQEGVPVAQEPKHHLVFENPYVRVIDARLPPGYVSLYHIHARDNVPVAIEGGAIEVQLLGQQPNRVQAESGGVSFARGSYTHRVSNLGTEEVRFIDAEIVASPAKRNGDQHGVSETSDVGALPGHAIELDNDRVRVCRLTLQPGESRPAHAHAGAVLEVVVRGDEVERTGRQTTVAPGAFHWFESGLLPATSNDGETPFEVVEIEWR